jgi:hypothetical protein
MQGCGQANSIRLLKSIVLSMMHQEIEESSDNTLIVVTTLALLLYSTCCTIFAVPVLWRYQLGPDELQAMRDSSQ